MTIQRKRARPEFFLLTLVVLALSRLTKCSTVFETNGQIPQVNFARRAASGNSFRCFGLSCSNGAALVTAVGDEEKSDSEPIIESSGSNFLYKKTRILRDAVKTLFRIDATLSVALSGIPSDCRHILSLLRKEALDYRSNYNERIPLGLLADIVSSYLHDLTLSSDTRPLAVTILLGARSRRQAIGTVKGTGTGVGTCTTLSGEGEVVQIDCDGSYNSYYCCSTKSADSRDEVSLTAQLRKITWGALTIEEAIESLRALLKAVEIQEEGSVEEEEQEEEESEEGKDESKSNTVVTPIVSKAAAYRSYTISEIIRITE